MLKKVFFAFISLCTAIMIFICWAELNGKPISVWTASSYENIFQETLQPDEESTSVNLVVAKNEYESAQILLRNDADFIIKKVSFSDLKSEAGTIAAENVKYNFVEYVYMGEHTVINDPVSPDFVEPPTGAAGYYPDALSNILTGFNVEANKTQPIWVTLFTPKLTTAGTYTGKATVYTDAGKYVVDICVEVNDVAIPETKDAQFDLVFWTNIDASSLYYDDDTHPNDNITPIYGHERWSEGWWNLVGNMAENMKEHRMNVLFVHPVQLLRDGGTTIDEKGNYVFNWSKFDEYIQFHLDRGYVKKIQAFPLLATVSFEELKPGYIMRNEEGQYYVDVFPYWIKNTDGSDTQTITPETEKWFSQYLPELYSHLREKGWLNMWQQLIGDEASRRTQIATYEDLYAKVKSICPDMKTADTINNRGSVDFHKSLTPTVDIQIPLTSEFERNEKTFKAQKEKGREIYTYVCNWPQGPSLNRFIDKPVWQMRSIGWLSYRWDTTGFLHWAWHHWTDQNRHYQIPVDDEDYKGDHYTVWPDVPNNTVKSSIRNAAARDAAEDYELLYILGERNPKHAKDLAGQVALDSSGLYNRSISDMIEKRIELVRAAAQ